MYNYIGDVMKKIFLALISFLLLTGCGRQYIKINYNELETKLNNKENFVLVIGSATCSACELYEETMKEVMSKNNIDIYFIDLDALNDSERSKVYTKFAYTYTPTTVFIKNGEDSGTHNRFVGAVEYEEIIERLEKLGYIGE